MITVSVCYSRKEGAEFASCSLGNLELAESLLEHSAELGAAIRIAYARCREAVDVQLIGTDAAPPADSPPVNPAVARVNQPLPTAAPRPAAPPASPPPPPAVAPPANGTTYYGNNNGPPKTGKQLGGWAKTQGCLAWFEAFGAAQKPSPLPKLCSQWTDQWAVYAYNQYMATQQAPPAAVSSSNGNGHHPY